jgi:hypothetical protein
MPLRARDVLLILAMAGAAAGLSRVCHAQQAKVELRIVERTGQMVASPSDKVLNFAVQGRVLDPGSQVGIGGFAFAIIFNGEAPTAGTLARDPISLIDGQYFGGTTGAPEGSFIGVARQYQYLVGLDGRFNGLINASGGGWTQTPSTDIGLISGLAAGQYLLGTPGVDTDLDGAPDTSSGEEAVLAGPIMSSYFGAGGNWIDLYRFRYTVSSFTARTLDVHLVSTSSDPDPSAFLFTKLESVDGSWGMVGAQVSVVQDDIQGVHVMVVPAPGCVAMGAMAASMVFGRRRR